jgi:hypothetical protein
MQIYKFKNNFFKERDKKEREKQNLKGAVKQQNTVYYHIEGYCTEQQPQRFFFSR